MSVHRFSPNENKKKKTQMISDSSEIANQDGDQVDRMLAESYEKAKTSKENLKELDKEEKCIVFTDEKTKKKVTTKKKSTTRKPRSVTRKKKGT